MCGAHAFFMVGTLWAQESGDESVEGILGYGEKTVEVSTAQDLVDAVDSKHNITVLLRGDVTVTDSEPVFTGLVNDGPCWGDSHLFNLSNYVFKPAVSGIMWNLAFAPAEGATAGKVVRNGRAEFCQLGNLSFSGIHNITSDTDGTFTPFQPLSAEPTLAAASDTLSSSGYGGVFRSVSGLTNGESGGVYIHDNQGAVSFSNICYDGSSLGDVNCGITLKGGAIYADPEWNVEIDRNGRSLGGDVSFENVRIVLDRSAKYANSSQCYFYAYGGAIHTRDLSISSNYAGVTFNKVGIYQTAAHHDEGYGYGGALYLEGNSSISGNEGSVSFTDGGVSVVNTAKGGAIYLADGATLALENNGGDVLFTGNAATAAAIDGTLNDDALAQGGAVYLGSGSQLSIRGNEGAVSFSCNEAAASATQEDVTAAAAGGAIWGAAGSAIDISGNKTVAFVDNAADEGSAIYTRGTLSIRNNERVIFDGNKDEHAVHLAGESSVLQLSAAEGNTICFTDSLYAEGSAEFNADFEGAAQAGTIEFMSSSATILGKTVLNNGTLLLNQGSRLDATALSLTSSAAILAAEGKANTLTGRVEMAEGSTLALTLNGYNASVAVLMLDGLLTINKYYTLEVAVNGVLAADTEYVLLELEEEAAYAESAWNEERVHLKGDVAFADLVWQNNYTRLVYRTPPVPEPATGVLCLAALVPLVFRRRR